MTPEKRAQLQRLKELVGRMEVEKTPRRSFTPKQRQGVWDRQEGLCGCGCDEPLGLSWQVDHRIPIALGGAHEPGNWVGLKPDHHLEKTREDVRKIAKVNRIRKREAEGAKPSRLQSRGFDKRLRKKFDGSVVRR